MAKIVLNDVGSGFNLSKINANFQLIEDELNNKVLYRDNVDGEANQWVDTQDANSQRLINLPNAINPTEPVTLAQFNAQSGGTKTTSTLRQLHTATAGQTVFSSPEYVIGSNNLSVYINGVKQNSEAYSETTTTSLTLSEGAELGDKVEVLVNELQESTDQVGATNVTYDGTTVGVVLDALTVDTIAAAKALDLQVGKKVKTWGYTTAGDGGGAEYQVVAGGTGTDDGGSYHDMNNGNQLELIHNGIISAKTFGATGSGDETTVIKNLFTAAAGKTIILEKDLDCSVSTAASSLLVNTNGTVIKGGGKITASDSVNKLIVLSANDCLIENIQLEGDGTFTQSTSVANTDRVALVYVTGDKNTIRDCTLTNGHQNFIHVHSADKNIIHNNKFIGGVASQTDTGYQGIRATDVNDTEITKNKFYLSGTSKTVQAIFLGKFLIDMVDNKVNDNFIEGCFDHGIYSIGSDRSEFNHNIVESDSSGIVVSGKDNTIGDVVGCSIHSNTLSVGTAVGSTTPAIYARDCNNFNISNNIISGFPTGISLTPVQYNTNNNTLDGNIISGNTITGFTNIGISMSKGGLTAGSFSYNVFSGNSIAGGAGITNTSVGVSMSIGQVASVDVNNYNKIEGNTIRNVGNAGISISNAAGLSIQDNKLVDVCEDATGTIRAGIYVSACTDAAIDNNKVIDTKGTSTTNYGIDGVNTCVGSVFSNNTIKNVLSIPIRRTQQGGHTNSHFGNKTGDDPLTGTVTLSAAATTTVNNDNINAGSGYTTYVKLQPINTSAGTLVGSTKSPVTATGDYVSGTSFKIRTADGAAAVGTEQFFYEIIG